MSPPARGRDLPPAKRKARRCPPSGTRRASDPRRRSATRFHDHPAANRIGQHTGKARQRLRRTLRPARDKQNVGPCQPLPDLKRRSDPVLGEQVPVTIRMPAKLYIARHVILRRTKLKCSRLLTAEGYACAPAPASRMTAADDSDDELTTARIPIPRLGVGSATGIQAPCSCPAFCARALSRSRPLPSRDRCRDDGGATALIGRRSQCHERTRGAGRRPRHPYGDKRVVDARRFRAGGQVASPCECT